ncbi:tetratricopeptide repeat-containing sulfotransferase family protein [Algirhabdus cladophorae]|uniref:tetratricopeptide repeat-containing sulfotransferase family protein n=1 Tax=Algirhabdus cladophorae TaxID=3377108 RepID=UPI003B8485EF
MPPLTPPQIPAVFKQAQAFQAKGDVAPALALYTDILAVNPDIPEVHFQIAQIHAAQFDLVAASQHFTKAVALRPNEPAIWQAITRHLTQMRDPALARSLRPILAQAALPSSISTAARAALDRAKATSKPAAKLIALRLKGERSVALAEGQKLIKVHPKDYDLVLELAILQSSTNAFKAAAQSFQKASALSPKAIFPRLQHGIMLQRLGDMEAADRKFRQILKINPAWGETYWLIAVGHKFTKDDPLIAQMDLQFQSVKDLPSKMFLGYALGKAMQDTQQKDRVFGYLNVANEIGRKLHPYDVRLRLEEVSALKSSFAGQRFKTAPQARAKTVPVFITGLPRSGTTLVEQILAAHPLVQSAGETGFPLEAVYGSLWNGSTFLNWGDLDGADRAAIADNYESKLRGAHDFDRFVTDKSIQSHLVIGPLLETIPNAKVVVVHRDPRDIALSCYKNFFTAGTHRYSNALEDLARYFQSFQDIVGFWRESLPDGAFHEISYEALVADQEAQSRSLIAACGLDWDDNCLNFHHNSGAVSTLSVAQVRQPIHQRSAQAWRAYESDLSSFINVLEE